MGNVYYLEMIDINKTFPGGKVLKNVDLQIKPGEVRALMGENGAGKSTLINILGGIHQKDKNEGYFKINGQKVEINSVQDAKNYGISIIHQEICLAENMSVADNIFMGCEIFKSIKCFLNDKEMYRKAQSIVDEMEIDIDVREKVGNLSIAKQQMIEICKAILAEAKLIVMDEPTSSLTNIEIEQLFCQIEKLRKSNIAIIYISHRMDEIFRISDSITVLRDGCLIGTGESKNLNTNKIIEMMVGRDIDKYKRRNNDIIIGKNCLSVKGISNKKLKNVSFTIKSGEILGFAGLVGAGRTELARAIFGIDTISSGDIYIENNKVNIKDPLDAIGYGIGYVPESRKEEGLFLNNSIKYNMTIPVLEKFIKFIIVNKEKENEIVNEYTNKLSIKMASSDQEIRYLSGGNQQKVVLGKWLATNPKILILDEPTRGIDIGSKTEIYHLIYKMAKQGVAIILISSEMEEIINLSTRVIVMSEGKVSGQFNELDMETVTQEKIMWYAAGGRKGD